MIKNFNSKVFLQVVFIGVLLSLFAIPVLSEAAYTYEEVWPTDWTGVYAQGINNSNTVVGWGSDPGYQYKGFMYSAGSYTELLPTIVGGATTDWESVSGVSGINNYNVAAGWGYDANANSKGFIYNSGSYTELLPSSWNGAWAHDINDSGVVAGGGTNASYYDVGYIYNGGTYKELLPAGWDWADARSINNNNLVVGFGSAGSVTTGFLYDIGSSSFLNEDIRPDNTWDTAMIYGINDNGLVVGGGSGGGFIYNSNTASYTILDVDWLTSEWAYGINNNNGDVVGWGYDTDWNRLGFVYSNGVYTPIKPDGWLSAEAYGINDNGAIVGFGDNYEMTKGFVATPEPVSSILFVIGGAVLAGRRYLRKKSRRKI